MLPLVLVRINYLLNTNHQIYKTEIVCVCDCNMGTRFLLHPPKLTVAAEGTGGQALARLTLPVLWFTESYPSISAFSFTDDGRFLIMVPIDFLFFPI